MAREFRARIKAIHGYAKANPNDQIRTDHFRYQAARSELYFDIEETGPVKVDLDSYSEYSALRELMEIELANQIRYSKIALPPETEQYRDRVTRHAEEHKVLAHELALIGCRLSLSREDEISIVRISEEDKATEKQSELKSELQQNQEQQGQQTISLDSSDTLGQEYDEVNGG